RRVDRDAVWAFSDLDRGGDFAGLRVDYRHRIVMGIRDIHGVGAWVRHPTVGSFSDRDGFDDLAGRGVDHRQCIVTGGRTSWVVGEPRRESNHKLAHKKM